MNRFLFVFASAVSAFVAYSIHQTGFSFATAPMSQTILTLGIGAMCAGAVAMTTMAAFRNNNNRGQMNQRQQPPVIRLPVGTAVENSDPSVPVVSGIEVAMPVTRGGVNTMARRLDEENRGEQRGR